MTTDHSSSLFPTTVIRRIGLMNLISAAINSGRPGMPSRFGSFDEDITPDRFRIGTNESREVNLELHPYSLESPEDDAERLEGMGYRLENAAELAAFLQQYPEEVRKHGYVVAIGKESRWKHPSGKTLVPCVTIDHRQERNFFLHDHYGLRRYSRGRGYNTEGIHEGYVLVSRASSQDAGPVHAQKICKPSAGADTGLLTVNYGIAHSLFPLKKMIGHSGRNDIAQLDLQKIKLIPPLADMKRKYSVDAEDLKRLKADGKRFLDIHVLEGLLKHPELIPKSWKKVCRVYFCNTSFGRSHSPEVPYIYFDGQRWDCSTSVVCPEGQDFSGWHSSDPAAYLEE